MTIVEDLYVQYHKQVYRFAFGLCGNRYDAEDITSETFLRAMAGADNLRAATVRAYLFTIARNLCLRARRRAGRQAGLDESLADVRPPPDRQAEDRRRWEQVSAALAALPELDRAAILMRADDMPYDEIAQVLGLSVPAARVRVHRARLRLTLQQAGHEVPS
jgi:RNA polymerase sigma-70 factor (ECF subfamily)